MVKWVLLFVVSGFLVLSITLYFNLGAYKDVSIAMSSHPGFHAIYKEHRGPYHEISPVIGEVETWALKQNLSCPQTFGEYIDKPGTVDDNRLRSNGGCMVRGPIAELPEGFFYKHVKPNTFLMASFGGAPSIGPFVVYPKVEEWLVEKGFQVTGPVFEVYTIQGAKRALTEYLFPVGPSQ